VASAFLFLAARRGFTSRVALIVLAVLALLASALVVDNDFGRLVVAPWGLAFALLAWKSSGSRAQVACAFAGIDLGLSVFSRGDYLFASTAHTGAGDLPSDVVQVESGLGGFYWAWGALIGAVSVVIVAVGLWFLVRRSAR
jgi:hypothetical protein